jgi:hypothetical protein
MQNKTDFLVYVFLWDSHSFSTSIHVNIPGKSASNMCYFQEVVLVFWKYSSVPVL